MTRVIWVLVILIVLVATFAIAGKPVLAQPPAEYHVVSIDRRAEPKQVQDLLNAHAKEGWHLVATFEGGAFQQEFIFSDSKP